MQNLDIVSVAYFSHQLAKPSANRSAQNLLEDVDGLYMFNCHATCEWMKTGTVVYTVPTYDLFLELVKHTKP